ncbi:alpha/beta fold hydrolase [Halorussus marinus]|uniref:alpha/beta fold hydrolase n=1 Tax=Halorussus marinus TaxID=2505976 RepID=UPI00106ED7A7|nr:alpha/beta hydrolase [Halorussus marinus]
MQHVTHHGRTTGYRVADRGGDGSPLLLVHGSGGTHEVWKGQLARLSGERPIAALDLGGHGESEDFDADAGWETLSAYVDDVAAVADAVGPAALVGNSLGGAVALQYAIGRDHDLAALALAGTGAKLPVLSDLLEWLDSDFERAVEFLHGEDRLFHDADSEYVDLSTAAMHGVGRRVTARDFLTCHEFDVRDRLGDIAVPALAVVGEHDKLTPPEYHERLAAEIPDGRYREIDDAAHLAMLERPAAFNDALREFLADEDV